MLKLNFAQSLATLDVTNSSLDTVIFDPKEMSEILDLRSMNYYKIKQDILQQNLSKYYRFESANTLMWRIQKIYKYFKEERKEETNEKYPWLDPSDERKYMSDREILERYIFIWQREKWSNGNTIQIQGII